MMTSHENDLYVDLINSNVYGSRLAMLLSKNACTYRAHRLVGISFVGLIS